MEGPVRLDAGSPELHLPRREARDTAVAPEEKMLLFIYDAL